MQKSTILFLAVAVWSGSFLSAAADAPIGQSTVVGAVVVDLYGNYAVYPAPQVSNLPVRIAVEYIEANGKTKIYSYRINTDENGYFKIEGAPAGRYIVKGVELDAGQSVQITAISEYGRWQKGERYRFWGLMAGQMFHNEDRLFPRTFETPVQSGLIDLGITYLKIQANERLGGSPFSNYSPNGLPPYVRLSLNQGYKNADFAVVDYKTYAEIASLQMQETDVEISMQSPTSYFGLE